ncbi:MAG: thiol reductant ABC exporter subunit CydD [Anaerolineales bacterium]
MQSVERLEPASGLRLNRRLLAQLSGSMPSLAIVLGLSLGLGVVIVAQAWVLSRAVTALFLPHKITPKVDSWLWGLVVLAALRAGLLWARGWWAGAVSTRAQVQVRQQAIEGLLNHGPAHLGQRPSGEWTVSLVEGVESLDPYFRNYLPALATAVIVPVAIVATVLPLDPISGLVLLVTAPLVPFFMILIGRTANQRLLARWDLLRVMSGHFLEVVQGLPTLRLLGRTGDETERIRSISNRFRRSTIAVLRVAFLSALVLEWAATLSTALIAVEIGLRLLTADLAFQTALFILLLAPEFFIPLRSLGARFHDAAAGTTAAETALELASSNVPDDPTLGEPALTAHTSRPTAGVSFSHVSFTYPDRDLPALDDISFTVGPSERLMVLGPSGAGKSTLAWLLLGLLRPDAGVIRIGGEPVPSLIEGSTHGWTAWVPQSPYLFSGTIADNLRFARPGATMAELERAVARADAAEFISGLPDGLQTSIGERAVRLSAGQARRLALARAFLVDSPLLLLDEPTAHLDWRAAEAIQRTLDQLMQSRTTILISHRLRGVMESDQVLILADGRTQAIGDPNQLIAEEGPLRRMMATVPSGSSG